MAQNLPKQHGSGLRFVSPAVAAFEGSGLDAANFILRRTPKRLPYLWNEILLAHVWGDLTSFGKGSPQAGTVTKKLLLRLRFKARCERSIIILKPQLQLSTLDVDRFVECLDQLSIEGCDDPLVVENLEHLSIRKHLEKTAGDIFRIGQVAEYLPSAGKLEIASKSLLAESFRQAKVRWNSKVSIASQTKFGALPAYKRIDCGIRESDTMMRKISAEKCRLHYAYALYKLKQHPALWWQRSSEAERMLNKYLILSAKVYRWAVINKANLELESETLKAAATVFGMLPATPKD